MESKSYKKGKATAKLWKAELDTRGKVLQGLFIRVLSFAIAKEPNSKGK